MSKKTRSVSIDSIDSWFLNFLFLTIIIVGIVSATVLAQRRAILVNKAAMLEVVSNRSNTIPQVEDLSDEDY